MKKKLLCMLMVLTLTMGMSAVFAYGESSKSSDTTIQPHSTFAVAFATDRISDTKADASVYVRFSAKPVKYTITITLQKKSSGSWVTASDVTNHTIKYIGSNKTSTTTYDKWTVKKGVIYRIKCTSVDKYDGISYSSTNYSDPF